MRNNRMFTHALGRRWARLQHTAHVADNSATRAVNRVANAVDGGPDAADQPIKEVARLHRAPVHTGGPNFHVIAATKATSLTSLLAPHSLSSRRDATNTTLTPASICLLSITIVAIFPKVLVR